MVLIRSNNRSEASPTKRTDLPTALGDLAVNSGCLETSYPSFNIRRVTGLLGSRPPSFKPKIIPCNVLH